MEKASEDIILAIIVSSIILVILAVFTTLFFLVFVRKKRILEKKRELLQQNFERQLLETKLEIQSQTLNNISQDLHDNIGQVLSFVKLSLSMAVLPEAIDSTLKIKESIQLIATAIVDLRDLSRSLSFERLKQEGLPKVIGYESERLNRSGIISSVYEITGTPVPIAAQTELIIFRMFQEIVNNILKHSGSQELFISLTFKDRLLSLEIRDTGNGFDKARLIAWEGLGMENIAQRAKLIGASVSIESAPGQGCITVVEYRLPDA